MRRGFEPLWEAPSTSLVARQEFAKVLDEITVKMRDIYREAGIANTEDGNKNAAPTQGHLGGAAQGSGSVTTVARVQGISTVARQSEWPTYTDTIHKKEDTSYDIASTEASLMAFGQHTLNDFYEDPMEDSPLEIVKSSPAFVSLLPKIEPDETPTFSEPQAKPICPKWRERQGAGEGERKDEQPVTHPDEYAHTNHTNYHCGNRTTRQVHTNYTNCHCENRTTSHGILRKAQRAIGMRDFTYEEKEKEL
ncbi:hypothetical protein MAR_027229 [Mya arenaria]|uniref:Uncharacterized protein n=1 Tax=Mya arenaria TaxID=6604 RepID=A0ABY7EVB9_MYAAR|nr:hypothetical protein MAR_027229 [Mya arenaria]